ncbi:MAG: hypothetical protein CML31_05470 [Rhizobiales bacterium]|nr:hypothetical protein [Hoeflea sp.]MBG19403.1 hypothetical protein [Hyphomicrobiales bacterium]|tara:strand:- start:7236 stop:7460 length:225 start_codon:yes stop_codon:yes gene_type:complete
MTPTNSDRAAWAYAAIEGFRMVHAAEGELQTDIKDLITDLLHLARLECGVKDVAHFAQLAAEMAEAEEIEDSDG